MTQVPVTKFYFSLLQQTGKKRRLFPVLKLPKICSFFSVTMHVWHGSLLFDQYISHGLNMLLTIIWQACSFIATRVGVIVETSSTESNSRVACVAVFFLVANDTDSCLGLPLLDTNHIESFFVTEGLERSLRANQRLPHITTQRRAPVAIVCDNRVQGIGVLVHDNGSVLLAHFHHETDLGEGKIPISRQLGLIVVKSRLPSWKIERGFVVPKCWVVVKGWLRKMNE